MKLLVIALFASVALGQSQTDQKSTCKPAPEKPEFFDKPTFVVSGVTDYTYRGGHGSDAVLRSTEALTAEAAALKKDSAASSARSSATPAAREHAVAEADENRGDSLDAVREYQRAAELDASESNLFDWGLELLTHRAAEPAIEVFTKGNRLFPGSVRMLLGLAVAFYMRGDFDRAARRFFEASDLRPDDPTPYMFLGRVQANAIIGSREYLQRLARFAKLEPENAWANYYYAAALWKGRANSEYSALTSQVRQLLDQSIRINPSIGPAYLLLGTVYFEQKDLPSSISAYEKAVAVNPDMEEAHYRLSQAYELTGEKRRAREELAVYKQLSNDSAQQSERKRREVQQFVFTLTDKKPDY